MRRILDRVRRMPPAALVGLGAVIAVLLVWGGVEAYRTYDYVQHDNEFCLSCHLMVEPYERFARSAHADLGCKACHQPTLVARSTMALTQILENPDSISVHAHVPNAACIECHVDGDPEEWSNIAASAGHRVHLESEDPALADLNCVECHSSSVHEFTATDQTCGQAGCHENQDIQLGAMGDLTIHCATCHEFNAQVASQARDTVEMALHPRQEECLSCHAMQVRLENFPIPAEDPHAGMCASCHNPHAQAESSEAFGACTDCHTQVDTLTAFHRGLDAGVLESCSRCHQAHTFHAEGQNCLACHTDPAQRGPATPPPHPQTTPASAAPRTSMALPRPHSSAAEPRATGTPQLIDTDGARAQATRLAHLVATLVMPAKAHAQQAPSGGRLQFDHARHTRVECTECHSTTNTHGRVTTTTVRDCRSCHHTGTVARPCARCHDAAAVTTQRYDVRRAYQPTVGTAENRTLPFDHRPHAQEDCATCHRTGLELSAARIACSGCHEDHHSDADTNCLACHETPAATAHTATAHLTCAGSGCHSAAPVRAAQRTRNLCLSCHQDLTDHQPGRRCVDCHALPAARQASAAGEAGRAGPTPGAAHAELAELLR